MRALAAALPVVVLLSGCVTSSGTGAPGGPGASDPSTFTVPWMRVGDELGYNFTFTQGTGRSFTGQTTLKVVGATTTKDGYGTPRPSIHLRQSNPDGTFAEDYFIDASTFRQLKLQRQDTYNETATLEPPAGAPLAAKHSYANATGVLERYAYDPFFEDANMFGVFLTGLPVPDNGTVEVPGNLWQRNATNLLQEGAAKGTVTIPAADERWGILRSLDFQVRFDQGETYFEHVQWNGDFSNAIPFVVRAERTIQANFFGEEFDVTFLLTLSDYKPGTGQVLQRSDGADPGGPAGERAAAPRVPADGNGDTLAFPLSEMVATLERDATAIQFFRDHADSYLYFAEMYDVDTCEFYQQSPPPGCHWLQWYGVFFAPDDWILTFTVEKYANADGTGASYSPAVTREVIFDTLFESAGGDPGFEPTPAIVSENSGVDLAERATYPADSLTVAGAIALWKSGASSNNQGQQVNLFWTHLTSAGYEFEVSNVQWEFPPENPEFFPMYDNMPFELPRHVAAIEPDGLVVEHRNYDVVIEHR